MKSFRRTTISGSVKSEALHYRMLVMGDAGVGKSALTIRYCCNTFVSVYDPTIEESYKKLLEVDDTLRMIDILDTAGQEEFSALREHYIREADGVIVVFSVTAADSFDYALWLTKEIRRVRDAGEFLPVILAGNKKDNKEARQVVKELASVWALSQGQVYMETSAKTGYNVDELFRTMVHKIDEHRAVRVEAYRMLLNKGKMDKKKKKQEKKETGGGTRRGGRARAKSEGFNSALERKRSCSLM